MPNILLVEDDELMISMYENLLTSKGFKVSTVKNGEECLFFLKTKKPDLILLDIMMPKMDGLDTLKNIQLNSATKDIPVIVLSNLNSESIMTDALSKGVKQYFVKSDVENTALIKRINELISK